MVDRKYLKSEKKMGERYTKRNVLSFSVGDKAMVRIPCIDQANSDCFRMPCVVVGDAGRIQNLYHLRNWLSAWTCMWGRPFAVIKWINSLVCNISAIKYLQCRSQHGVLNVCYPASELEEYNGSLSWSAKGWQQAGSITLRDSAWKQAPWNSLPMLASAPPGV